jgi:hypothetical protein
MVKQSGKNAGVTDNEGRASIFIEIDTSRFELAMHAIAGIERQRMHPIGRDQPSTGLRVQYALAVARTGCLGEKRCAIDRFEAAR